MRIVLFDYIFERDSPGITGLSDVVWNWAEHLVALGDEVHIVAPYAEHARPPQGAVIHRFAVPPIGYRNVLGHVLIVLRGWSKIRKLGKIDLIHAPEYLSTGILATLSRNIPVILTVPGNIFERVQNGNPFDWSSTQALKIAAKLSARNCAGIIATSDEMRRWWRRTGTPAGNIVLIPYGVDTKRFHQVADARTSLGIGVSKRLVLYVGRLSHEKGVKDLLEALHRIEQTVPELELHLVGDGPMRAGLQHTAGSLALGDRVVFHGWVNQPDLPLYYSAANVTVLPSFSEGLPRTMIEAMACGSPFLGTTITGIVDVVQDGETGYLVEPGNAASLASRLADILNNPDETARVAQRGLEHIQRQFEWGAIMRRIREEVYQPALDQRRQDKQARQR